MATDTPRGPTWASEKSQDEIEAKRQAFFADNSNPVELFENPNLTRDGLLNLRDRVLRHAQKEWLEQREGYLVPEVYTDELLALIARVIQLEDGLDRICRQTHLDGCYALKAESSYDVPACGCAEGIAAEALQPD